MIQSKEGLPVKGSPSAKGLIDFDDEPSGPYIPISECYTGKPVSHKIYHNSNHHLPPPPLPSCSSSVVHQPIPPPPLPHPHQSHHIPRSSVFTKVALPTCKSTLNSSSSSIHQPPPRPPKPTKLNTINSPTVASAATLNNNCNSNNLNTNNSINTSNTNINTSNGNTISNNIINNNCNSSNNSPNHLTGNNNNHNNLLNISTPQLTLDDVYDFPKSEPVFSSLRTSIPAPGNRATKGNGHPYTNAPPGHITKPPVFIYDYKGTLPTCLPENHFTFETEPTDRSPLTPNSAFDSYSSNGSLSKSLTPPAVDRNLKPRRKGSDSDGNSLPTSPTLTLSPPPVHYRSHHHSLGKPSRHWNKTPPRVPSRGRKSPNVTYLDLDLQDNDKDLSRPSNSAEPYNSSLSHSKDLSGASNLSGSQSTVYKSIDFVATDAFRQLRISSQRLIDKE